MQRNAHVTAELPGHAWLARYYSVASTLDPGYLSARPACRRLPAADFGFIRPPPDLKPAVAARDGASGHAERVENALQIADCVRASPAAVGS